MTGEIDFKGFIIIIKNVAFYSQMLVAIYTQIWTLIAFYTQIVKLQNATIIYYYKIQ